MRRIYASEFMRQTGLVLSRGISEKYHFRLTHKLPRTANLLLSQKVQEDHLCREGEFFTDPTTYGDSQVGGEKTYT
jgi:hypothetical protein